MNCRETDMSCCARCSEPIAALETRQCHKKTCRVWLLHGNAYIQFPRPCKPNHPIRPNCNVLFFCFFCYNPPSASYISSSWCPPSSLKKSCSATRYPANATVAMPRPGKEPLKRLKRVKGPVYRHCSLLVGSVYGQWCMSVDCSILSCPWVTLCAVGGGCSKLLGVKAGDGGACHDGAVRVSPCRARCRRCQLSRDCISIYTYYVGLIVTLGEGVEVAGAVVVVSLRVVTARGSNVLASSTELRGVAFGITCARPTGPLHSTPPHSPQHQPLATTL